MLGPEHPDTLTTKLNKGDGASVSGPEFAPGLAIPLGLVLWRGRMRQNSARSQQEEIMADLNTDGLEAEMLRVLVKTFPNAFFTPGRRSRPLRVGIFHELDAALPPEINRPRLLTHAAQFGITSPGTTACKPPSPSVLTGFYAYGPTCVPTTTPNPNYGYLVSSNALQTHFTVDGAHLTEAVQQILADYNYSLLTAPSEISFLAETAVKTRLGLVSTIQNQIELSDSRRGPSGVNAWVTGDVTSLSLDNYHGFPGDPDTVITGAAGVDYSMAPGLIAGFAFSGGSLTSALGTYGSFKQDETSASLYAAYEAGPLWANVIGTYGRLTYDVNRNVPIGISIQNNTGATSGDNWSAAFQGGYKFWHDGLTHGPIAGFVYQSVNVGGFTESGSFTSLGFGSQSRESDVGQFGYKVSYGWAEYQPFAQLTWNHEFADTNRNVTASLTTVVAPSYSLPAVLLGKDWGEIKGGVTIDVGSGVKVLAVGSADFSQTSATVYGGQLGFNIAF